MQTTLEKFLLIKNIIMEDSTINSQIKFFLKKLLND